MPTRSLMVWTWSTLCAVLLTMASGCRIASNGQNSLGVRLFQEGRYTEALQQFQMALNRDPSNPDAYYNLASTYHKLAAAQKDQRLVEQAESLYNQCLDLSPNHVDCHRGLAVLLAESGRPDAAMTLLKNWAARTPGLSAPRIELARLHQELGQTQLAERYLDEALAVNPHDYRAWAAKGQMREAAGQLTQALQNYQQSLAINSLQPDLYQRVAALNVRIAQSNVNSTSTDTNWTVQNQPLGGLRRY
ncbi:MAG: O-linked GlcNAc transferase [Pirellulaceae bacterium]|nr:MAG: O-linked GlcNAc transferase [Pirellulaceae bacterium]